MVVFFFKQKTAYEMRISDWSSDVCSSDLAHGATGINFTYFIQDPFTGLIRHLQCNLVAPNGTNWGHYCDKEMDELFNQVRNTFDATEQDKVLQKIHEKYVNEALFLMVTHDEIGRAHV